MWESRRLPASGAGPSPDRLLLGSEGTLAVITEAWVRIRPRDEPRWSARVELDDFAVGLELIREIVQSGMRPSNCRLVEAREAQLTLSGDRTTLHLGFEGAHEPAERARAPVRAVRPRDRRPAAARGATPSCARRTCATRWWPWACSPRPSRPPSPGTACRV